MCSRELNEPWVKRLIPGTKMEEHVRSRTRALAPAEQPVSAATGVNHLRGHGILQAELREDRLEVDMRAMSIDSQDQVSSTRADTVDRQLA